MTLNRDESSAAAAHLNYEIEAMAELCGWHRRLLEKKGPAALEYACLQATYVHLRLLIEFVSGRHPKDDPLTRHRSDKDIGPRDFVNDSRVAGWPPCSTTEQAETEVCVDHGK